jgi:hypothetical protein
VNGKAYKMARHGFARDTDFKLIAQGDAQVVYALNDSADTWGNYPYHFNLAVSYKLRDNKIHVVWHVENTDDNAIYFQIGGHPAFNVPDLKPGEPLKGRLRFDNSDPIRLFGKRGWLHRQGAPRLCRDRERCMGPSHKTASRTMPCLRPQQGAPRGTAQCRWRDRRGGRHEDSCRGHLEPLRQERALRGHRAMVRLSDWAHFEATSAKSTS